MALGSKLKFTITGKLSPGWTSHQFCWNHDIVLSPGTPLSRDFMDRSLSTSIVFTTRVSLINMQCNLFIIRLDLDNCVE